MRSLLLPFITALGAAGKVCSDQAKYPIELVFVQDTTNSFDDDFDRMKNGQLTQIKSVLAKYSGSRFGIVSFRDKPLPPYGFPLIDYCVKYEAALTADFSVIEDVYHGLRSTGGGDTPENSMGAILSAALSNRVGWSPHGAAPGGGNYTRIILLITDDLPHTSTDRKPFLPILRDHDGNEDSVDALKCATYWYPSESQTRTALQKNGIHLLGLIQAKAIARWKRFSTEVLGQPDDFIQELSSDSSNFSSVLESIMSQVDGIECETTTTTTKKTTTTTKKTTTTKPQTPMPPSTCPSPPPEMPEECRDYIKGLINFYAP